MSQEKFLVRFGLGFHEISYKLDSAQLNPHERVVSVNIHGDETKKELSDQARDNLIRYFAGINEYKPEQVRVQVYSMAPATSATVNT